MSRAIGGDELGRQLDRQSQRVRLTLAHLAGRTVLARVELDDLLQEVFLRAVARPEALPPEGADGGAQAGGDAEAGGDAALGRYLARIARNVVIDAVRAIRARKRDGRELAITDWSNGGVRASRVVARQHGPSTQLAGREAESRLVAAFQALSADHRRVLGLRQFEGLSAAEAGARMGRGEASIHSLYRRALEAWNVAAGF